MSVDTIVVHYSATYASHDLDIREVIKWHRERGFRTVGYHWFIKRDGTLQEGRPEGTMGAGVRGHNGPNIIHICWAGGLDQQYGKNKGVWNPSPAQEECLVRLIKDIQKRHPRAKKVVGHIDLGPSQCPGLPKGGVAKWWASKNTTNSFLSSWLKKVRG